MTCENCEGERFVSDICGHCSGSGEGMYDGSTCRLCRGTGEVVVECEECFKNDEDE